MSVTNIPNFVILKNTDKFYKNIYEIIYNINIYNILGIVRTTGKNE